MKSIVLSKPEKMLITLIKKEMTYVISYVIYIESTRKPNRLVTYMLLFYFEVNKMNAIFTIV